MKRFKKLNKIWIEITLISLFNFLWMSSIDGYCNLLDGKQIITPYSLLISMTFAALYPGIIMMKLAPLKCGRVTKIIILCILALLVIIFSANLVECQTSVMDFAMYSITAGIAVWENRKAESHARKLRKN